jgi:F-type H+-transporting ATPase subunit a
MTSGEQTTGLPWRPASRVAAPGWVVVIAAVLAWAGPTAAARAAQDGAGEKKPGAKKTEKDGGHEKHSALEHVSDQQKEWKFFDTIGVPVPLPKIFGFQITLFMVLEVIAALLVIAIYVPMARRLQSGGPPRGRWDNTFEVLLTFIRDDVAKPGIGDHDADRFVPFLWTMFLFILFSNLLGMIPAGGSPTANIFVTGALALIVFFAIHGSAIAKMGFGPYVKSMWPHIDVPGIGGLLIKVLVCGIEIVGVLVRNAVLAVRLFANMFAGHMVLATLLIFIVSVKNPVLWTGVTLASVLGVIALSLLEIFVAFLQAYIFVFLASLFMGLAMHPQH